MDLTGFETPIEVRITRAVLDALRSDPLLAGYFKEIAHIELEDLIWGTCPHLPACWGLIGEFQETERAGFSDLDLPLRLLFLWEKADLTGLNKYVSATVIGQARKVLKANRDLEDGGEAVATYQGLTDEGRLVLRNQIPMRVLRMRYTACVLSDTEEIWP